MASVLSKSLFSTCHTYLISLTLSVTKCFTFISTSFTRKHFSWAQLLPTAHPQIHTYEYTNISNCTQRKLTSLVIPSSAVAAFKMLHKWSIYCAGFIFSPFFLPMQTSCTATYIFITVACLSAGLPSYDLNANKWWQLLVNYTTALSRICPTQVHLMSYE